MRIWVDMANSPQVLLLRPIIDELENRGHETIATTRHHGETIALADKYGLEHSSIGAHGGGTLAGKGIAIILRALNLIRILHAQEITFALSSSSYSQAIAAQLMGIPFVTLNDYEGNPGMHIVCRIAKKILVPNMFSKNNLYHYGATEDQIESYNGLKESVYLSTFTPDPTFLQRLGIPTNKTLVTMRPASEVSAYHQFENPLFDQVLEFILSHDDVHVVLIPRDSKQRRKYASLQLPNLQMPKHVLNGPNLIFYSDLVVGAGGTMNREAVVLGTPAYSLFKGPLGSVDQHLIKSTKMTHIRNATDIPKIKIRKKQRFSTTFQRPGQDIVSEIVDKIILTISPPTRLIA